MHRLSTTLAVGLIVCVAATLRSRNELRQERERADSLQARVAQLDSSRKSPAPNVAVAMPEDPPVAAAPSPAPAQDQSAARRDAAPTSPTTEKESTSIGGDEYQRRLLRNAKYRQGWRTQRHLELASGHIDLTTVLQLSPATADQLLDILVSEELRYLEEIHPNPTNEEEIRARRLEVEASERAHDAEIAALIGSEKLGRWKEYQASLSTRHQVHQLRSTMATTAEPLREDQMEPLIAAIQAEQAQFKDEIREFSATLPWSDGMERQSHLRFRDRYTQRSRAAVDRIHAAAAPILSQSQLDSLDAMLRRQLDSEAASFQMERARSEMWAGGKLNIAESN